MGDKTNPRKIPATQADVKKAFNKGVEQGIIFTKIITFHALLDIGAIRPEDVKAGWDKCCNLADSINRGYINYNDLYNNLINEYQVDVSK